MLFHILSPSWSEKQKNYVWVLEGEAHCQNLSDAKCSSATYPSTSLSPISRGREEARGAKDGCKRKIYYQR